MIVKVCGVRTAAVAEAAVESGADWIGVVLEPRSPRYAGEDEVREVSAAVAGAADVVGVLVDAGAEECNRAAGLHRLAAVQVHGRAAPGLAAACDVPVIRGINVRTAAEAYTLDWWPDGLVLLDAAPGARGDGLPGGTGRRLPLAWAAEVSRHRPVLLAGGLGPDSVADAVAQVRPAGVDASSALERAPGEKDVALVRAFVRTARAAFDLLRERREGG